MKIVLNENEVKQAIVDYMKVEHEKEICSANIKFLTIKSTKAEQQETGIVSAPWNSAKPTKTTKAASISSSKNKDIAEIEIEGPINKNKIVMRQPKE